MWNLSYFGFWRGREGIGMVIHWESCENARKDRESLVIYISKLPGFSVNMSFNFLRSPSAFQLLPCCSLFHPNTP